MSEDLKRSLIQLFLGLYGRSGGNSHPARNPRANYITTERAIGMVASYGTVIHPPIRLSERQSDTPTHLLLSYASSQINKTSSTQ